MSGELASGWTVDLNGGIYHFEHILSDTAWERLELRELPFVVETINTTLAKGDPDHLHLNKHFAWTLPDAVALAAMLEITLLSVAEDVVGIRPATDDEVEEYVKAWEHFKSKMPEAIPDEEAA